MKRLAFIGLLMLSACATPTVAPPAASPTDTPTVTALATPGPTPAGLPFPPALLGPDGQPIPPSKVTQ